MKFKIIVFASAVRPIFNLILHCIIFHDIVLYSIIFCYIIQFWKMIEIQSWKIFKIMKCFSIPENVLPKLLNTQNILSVPSGTLPRSCALWLQYLPRQWRMKNAKGPCWKNEVIPWYSLPYSAFLLFLFQLYFITIYAKNIVIMVWKPWPLLFKLFLFDIISFTYLFIYLFICLFIYLFIYLFFLDFWIFKFLNFLCFLFFQ